MQKKKKKKGGWCETVPRHESQLHLMIAKGWSTCKLYCSSIVPPSTRRDHLSHQSQPALLPEHRRWIPAHHPCGYLCLTARKKESKAGYKAWKRHSFFLEARREDLRRPRWYASRHPSFLWIGAPTWHVLHARANPFSFCVWVILFRINSCFEIQMSQLCSTCGEVGRSLVGALGGGAPCKHACCLSTEAARSLSVAFS